MEYKRPFSPHKNSVSVSCAKEGKSQKLPVSESSIVKAVYKVEKF